MKFLPADDGYRGSVFPASRTAEIYVSDLYSDADLRHTLAHEAGHTLDVDLLDDDTRAGWIAQRGLNASWWAEGTVHDYASGSGDFAESVAWVFAGRTEWNGMLAGPPSEADVATLLALICRGGSPGALCPVSDAGTEPVDANGGQGTGRPVGLERSED